MSCGFGAQYRTVRCKEGQPPADAEEGALRAKLDKMGSFWTFVPDQFLEIKLWVPLVVLAYHWALDL